MAKRKPLPSEAHGVRIVSDCGMGKLHANSKGTVRIAIVECAECKGHRKINYYSLKGGEAKLCPSCSSKGTNNGQYKHGQNTADGRSRTYVIWQGMKQRCEDTNCKDFDRYGGRGIKVCEAWQDFGTFSAWAAGRLDDKSMSLERKDNDLGYDPDNVMVLPTHLQAYNRRNGIDMKTAIHMAQLHMKLGKFNGYILYYMNKFPHLKDHQVSNFILRSAHKEELAKLEIR